MTPIKDYIAKQEWPRHKNAAAELGTSPQQLSRWVEAGAYIHDNGTPYLPPRGWNNKPLHKTT